MFLWMHLPASFMLLWKAWVLRLHISTKLLYQGISVVTLSREWGSLKPLVG
jgi:hypothetical protein